MLQLPNASENVCVYEREPKCECKWDTMLIISKPGLRVHKSYYQYSCNFYVNLEIHQNFKLPKSCLNVIELSDCRSIFLRGFGQEFYRASEEVTQKQGVID